MPSAPAYLRLCALMCTCLGMGAMPVPAQSSVQMVEPEHASYGMPGALQAPPRPARYDSLQLRANLDRITKIALRQAQYHDSSAVRVFERMAWNNMCVVTDWTASMHGHDAMLIRWHLDQLDSGRIQHICLFNDGDGKYDDEKEIGLTGGIHHSAGSDSLGLWQAMAAATMGGNGGDHRENVLEAVLEGIAACPECTEIVLVADNVAPIRDLRLLSEIDRPIRVVLFGVYKDGILADYLNLAAATGGSIHTRDMDLLDIHAAMRNGQLQIGAHAYELRGKYFVKLKP